MAIINVIKPLMRWLILAALAAGIATNAADRPGPWFAGAHYRGRGDIDYLRLLENARRMFEPDPELQNISMLYTPLWNGFVEGPTWDAWWIQNSYGTTYCALPFYQEPYVTFLQNAQDLWFDQMGDGHHIGSPPPYNWAAPDGCLCDCAQPGRIIYRQGDGRSGMHDWAMEFTAAGVVLQSELLLISRDERAIAHYLPLLERSAAFIESRRDPVNNLFLAGPAANLLAPSYAGWARPDGTYGKAYLTGLSVTYIAALDRLIELEKMAGRSDKVAAYERDRALAKSGLKRLTTPQGYFIRSLDPDGVVHGVIGAPKHGYFEASPNHDAIAFRVVDDKQANEIYDAISSQPGLRPYDFILPNYPSYDDMYEKPEGLWGFGTWVNGGHWSTCEARMMLGYYRLGKFEDARRSMQRLMTFARKFRMDNPLVDFGSDVYQPNEPINLCYDTFGPAAGFMRGLFEFSYSAEGLTLLPHIPPGISELDQCDPVRLGKKRIYISTIGNGPVTGVLINGKKWKHFDSKSIFLIYNKMPDSAAVLVLMGGAKPDVEPDFTHGEKITGESPDPRLANLDLKAKRLRAFRDGFVEAGLTDTYSYAHANLALECIATAHTRFKLLAENKLLLLPTASQSAADQSYVNTASNLYIGFEKAMVGYGKSKDSNHLQIYTCWEKSGKR